MPQQPSTTPPDEIVMWNAEQYQEERRQLEEARLHRPPRPLNHPRFQDNEYNHLTGVKIFYNFNPRTQEESVSYFNALNKRKKERVEEFERFLHRHKLNVDLRTNNLDELDQFVKKNIDFSEDPYYEYERISELWASILVDLGFYLVNYVTLHSGKLKLVCYGAYKTLAIRGYKAYSTTGKVPRTVSHNIFDDLVNHYGRLASLGVTPPNDSSSNLSNFFRIYYNRLE